MLITASLILISLLAVALYGYKVFYSPNIADDEKVLFIKKNSSYADVYTQLQSDSDLIHPRNFDLAAYVMDYKENVKPGRYELKGIKSNKQLIEKLRSGRQDALKFRFQNIRLKENFAGLLGRSFEADSLSFLSLMDDKEYAESFGFTVDNFYSMFIPNTYEIYWNTEPKKIIERFGNEYKKFWNENRMAKAKEIGLSPQEVSTLAAVVQGEALHQDEMPKIAALYLNRLRKGILLQADPTVIFANNDFTIRRVLYKHLRFDSPYNTYIYKGLPPGPIMMPSIAGIDAVLNPAKHDYIYMCAKDDFSGYHNFASTLAAHQINARKFQKALNDRNIKK